MKRVLFYSVLLLLGMVAAQVFDFSPWYSPLHWITMVCLGYIMIEVGLEFSADMKHPSTYAIDSIVALSASSLPWILCAIYFVTVLKMPWNESLLVACFSAPTSAGVLFTLLAAAGLGSTWVFKKARVLAIFDDLSTILLLIPLQMMWVGWKPELLVVIVLTFIFLIIGYRWMNQSDWPVNKAWVLLYAFVVVFLCWESDRLAHIHLEVLLPAFVLGCVLRHHSIEAGDDPHSWIDQVVKAVFMLLVGCSLPKVVMGSMSVAMVGIHVFVLTLISNLGKCIPLLFYRNEATPRERLALSVAMFPRGEVGVGVLLMALGYGITGMPILIGSLSLAFNLLLTGLFIVAVKKFLL